MESSSSSPAESKEMVNGSRAIHRIQHQHPEGDSGDEFQEIPIHSVSPPPLPLPASYPSLRQQQHHQHQFLQSQSLHSSRLPNDTIHQDDDDDDEDEQELFRLDKYYSPGSSHSSHTTQRSVITNPFSKSSVKAPSPPSSSTIIPSDTVVLPPGPILAQARIKKSMSYSLDPKNSVGRHCIQGSGLDGSSPIPPSSPSDDNLGSTSAGSTAGNVESSFNPHPQTILNAMRDQVFSSFLFNKQRVQEKILPLLPFPSSAPPNKNPANGGAQTPGSSSPRTPFLLKSTDPVLEARMLALRHSRAHLRQVLKVTSGPIVHSLGQLNAAFSHLNCLLNEMNSSRLDFSSSSTSRDFELGRSSHSHVSSEVKDLTAILKSLTAESEKMRAGVEFLNANLETLVNKTMQDSLGTCASLETSRIEFDAERNYLLSLTASSSPTGSAALNPSMDRTRIKVQQLETKYVALKSDVSIKLDFLAANRDKVMNKSLSLLSALMGSFFAPQPTSSRTKLDAVLKAYSIKNVTHDLESGPRTGMKKSSSSLN